MSDEKSQIWGLPEKAGFIFYFKTFRALSPPASKRDCLFFKIVHGMTQGEQGAQGERGAKSKERKEQGGTVQLEPWPSPNLYINNELASRSCFVEK